MIRITGGEWRGREIRIPRSGVRPTQDRLRLAVFSSLGDAVVGARVLELFAGSGAFGLEALSRGAAFAAWIEKDGRVYPVLKANIEALVGRGDRGRARTIRGDALDPAALARAGREFDLVFADPPYETTRERAILPALLALVRDARVLRAGGLLVFEQAAGRDPAAGADGWELLRDREVGDSRWTIHRRTADGLGCAAAAAHEGEGFDSRPSVGES